MPESLIDQTLSGFSPDGILTTLFALLAHSRTVTATAAQRVAGQQDRPGSIRRGDRNLVCLRPDRRNPVGNVHRPAFGWKKTQLEKSTPLPSSAACSINSRPTPSKALVQRVGDLLGVWASLAEYEAVQTVVLAGLPAATLMPLDSALSLAYDQSSKLQWLGYRGVLTDTKKGVLTAAAAGLTPPAARASLHAIEFYPAANFVGLHPAHRLHSGHVGQSEYLRFDPTRTCCIGFGRLSSPRSLPRKRPAPSPTLLPQIQFSYDPIGKMQTLTCTGVLTDAMRLQLESCRDARPPGYLAAGRAQSSRGHVSVACP